MLMCRRCATKIHGRQKLCKRHSHRQELRICVPGSFTPAISISTPNMRMLNVKEFLISLHSAKANFFGLTIIERIASVKVPKTFDVYIHAVSC